MAKILDMPKLSPTMEEGQLAVWHKKEGDTVNVDDVLAEVETDKATMEFRSFDKGVILKILVSAGSSVKLGQPVAILGEAGEDFSALLSKVGPISEAKKEAKAAEVPTPTVANIAPSAATAGNDSAHRTQLSPPFPIVATKPVASRSDGIPKASPYVRKLAREKGLDLSNVAGSGPHGRIVARDVESANTATVILAPTARETPVAKVVAPQPSAPSNLAAPEVRPLSMMRKTIARRLTESKQTVPHFYLQIDIDAGELVSLREKINSDLAASTPKNQDPEKISINDLLIKACAIALVRVPECNAQFSPEAILVHQRVDISVAVAVPEGLVTPVLRNADRKSVVGISREVRDLAQKAKNKKLTPEEMSNGTFSISNLGMFGIDSFSAVINPPEGAILAVGQVRAEPVVRGEQIVPGKKLAMTLSCDHRVIDGAVGARYLAELRKLLEHPTQILVL